MYSVVRLFFIAAFILTYQYSFAGHPLRTDDTGTVGTNGFQLELTPEVWKYSNDLFFLVPITSTYGISSNVDVVLAILFSSLYNSGFQSDQSGINDVALELKWRLLELENFSVAVKPWIILPVGDHTKGLGAGKVGYSLFIVTDQELFSLLTHINIGYVRNENKLLDRIDLWITSPAVELPITNSLSLVIEIGAFSNSDKSADGHPVYFLGGAVYSITEGIGIDPGLQKGLNNYDSDLAVLTGLTVIF